MYYTAAALLLVVGFAHSFLGERYLIRRLLRRQDLPKILNSEALTRQTLRAAWHLTTVAWAGFAAILVIMATPAFSEQTIAAMIAVVFLIHFLVAALGSRGKHLSWILFLLIGVSVLYAAFA